MRSLITLLRLLASALVTLFPVDSIVSHVGRTSFLTQSNPHDQLVAGNDNTAEPQGPTTIKDRASHDSVVGVAHNRLHSHVHTVSTPTTHTVTSWTSADQQIQHYSLERKYAESDSVPAQSVLFLTLTRDEKSWGRNPDEKPRTIYDFHDSVTNTTLTPSAAAVAVLTSSPKEFERYKEILTPADDEKGQTKPREGAAYYDYSFHRISIVLHTAATRSPLADHTREALLARARARGLVATLFHSMNVVPSSPTPQLPPIRVSP